MKERSKHGWRGGPGGRLAAWSLGLLTTGLLFWGFFANGLRVADPKWFDRFQGSEALVVGRMVKSRQDGLFSAGGLNGWVLTNQLPVVGTKDEWIGRWNLDFQYRVYLEGAPFYSYHAYLSQPGGQSLLFSVLDGWLPWSGEIKLRVFHGLTALLSALTLALVVVWFLREFGWCGALGALASLVLSQWLVVFGGNLWWSAWAFYLPMAGVMYFLRRDRSSASPRPWRGGLLVFGLVFLKCLINGFEFITTTLVMLLVPFVYEAVREGRRWRTAVPGFLAAGTGAALAVVVGLAVLSAQIAAVKGSLRAGIGHVVYSFQKRTYAEPENFPAPYRPSLASPASPVLRKYLQGAFVNLGAARPPAPPKPVAPRELTYQALIGVFLVASLAVCLQRKRWIAANEWRRSAALVAATWFSVLAPLSWLVIFKAHSYVHLQLNFVVWQMPFTIFGFAVTGLAVRSVFLRLRLSAGEATGREET
ncbi:hypothetical protein HQ590_16665 [bacterium]|nr:hypothetical protein [bacterium]